MKTKHLPIAVLCLFLSLNISAQPPCAADQSVIEVSITTDQFGGETSWSIRDIDNDVILHSVAEGEMANSTTHEQTVCAPCGTEIEFQIFDKFGDGICCFWGNGEYTIDLDGVNIATSNSNNNPFSGSSQTEGPELTKDCPGCSATCRDITVYLDEDLIATISADSVFDYTAAGCSLDTLFVDKDSADCSELGIHTVVLTVQPLLEDPDTCHARVTVMNDPDQDLCCLVGETDNFYIEQVAEYMSGQSNASGDNNGYKDFTDIEFVSNNPYFPFLYFFFTPGGGVDLMNWEMYIDWNDNLLFEAGEKMMDYCSAGSFLNGISLAGQPGGAHRMRLIMQADTDDDGCLAGELPIDLCGPIGEGEVEDYSVVFAAGNQSQTPNLSQFRHADIELFPNPVGDEFFLTLTQSVSFKEKMSLKVDIINSQGRTVLHKSETYSGDPLRFDARNLPAGTYFLKVRTGTDEYVETFLKN